VQKTISEIVPSKDPLDSPDFNYIDYINKLFPTEQSLEKLDDEIKRIKIKIQRVDEEIMSSVYKQSRAGMKGKQELERAKKSIQELFAKIKEIKSKASESEQMVQDICRDICDLDFAKKNLTTSMTALKRLHDLITMLEQLKVMAEKRQYREVGNLYEGVTQILILFNDYKEVPKIKELQSEVETLKAQLQKQIYDEFENPNLKHLDQHEIMNLSNACFVVDALGSETRREVMNRFCQKILTNYQRDFKDGTEVLSFE
jgi:protein subunit release factor A